MDWSTRVVGKSQRILRRRNDLSRYLLRQRSVKRRCFDKQVSGNVETIAEYSGRGPTIDGRIKPEITAVGGPIRTVMSADSLTTGGYVGMYGTSMAAPLVAGAIALLFENSPDMTRIQSKDY